MPVHIDQPAPGMTFDPRDFVVRGWTWLEAQQSDLLGVEAWSGEILLGQGNRFEPRADVSAKYGLSAATPTAFEFPARHPSAVAGEAFDLELRARLRSEASARPIFTSRVGAFPLDRDPLNLLRARVAPTALGLEIGAHRNPTPGLSPFFTDSVALFAGSEGRVDFLADALALPIADNTLDYLCSSHVLEHLPNPLAALHEWHRVLRPGGWLYLVVPDKRFTFDAPRDVTTCAHLLEDFQHARTSAESREHVDDFVYHADWSILRPDTPVAERPMQQAAARAEYLEKIDRGVPIDIHFHTFTPDSFHDFLQAARLAGAPGTAAFELESQAERYPPDRRDGIAVLLRKTSRPVSDAAPAPTFALAHADAHVASLPLVCPVTLSPLRRATRPGVEDDLAAVAGGRRYRIDQQRPVLFPATKDRPLRLWTDGAWRRTWLARR